jgi:Fe-S cluster assembly protein SufD
MTKRMTKFINLNKEKTERLVLNKPGNYVVFFHNLSGKYVFEISAPNVNLDIFGLFTGKNDDKFTIETVQHHRAPNSTSNLLIKGVFQDSSKFIYQGLIRIEKSAQKSHAYQKNQNLIFSEKCYIDSRPFLEILANDVFCTHGFTTGKLNKDQLYYLRTRGIENNEAAKLLTEGFINDIFEKIHDKFPSFSLTSEVKLD